MESFSPEEKLLQLIRKRRPKKEDSSPSEKKVATPPPQATSPLRPSLRNFFKRKTQPPSAWADEGKISLFKKLNQGMAVAFGIFLSLFLVSFFWGRVRPEPRSEPTSDEVASRETGTKASPSEISSRKPYTYYAADIEKRNIFGPSLYTEPEAPSGEPALQESLKDLTLIGIVSGKIPQAILEDKKEGKTFFVNPGDSVGLLRVEEIREDRVIFNYRGERVDLPL